MDSKTEVCNLALAHLNVGQEITDFETENSRQARSCRIFFDMTFKKILRDYSWPAFMRHIQLAEVDTHTNVLFSKAFRVPENVVFIKGISPGPYPQGNGSSYLPHLRYSYDDGIGYECRVHYTLGGDDQGKLLFADADQVTVEAQVELEPSLWPDDFTMAFSLLLASYIAGTVTGGDQFKLGAQCLQRYQMDVAAAVSAGLNEQNVQRSTTSGFEAAR